ncbi:23470_t:CDS:10 [Entrophospora sp. SA101]|nr:23470_t:CDS:10 [Entrophospora sp. SA101]CAJ0874619.1 4874_t:CDS:10 [Entrophospora sp. SA101]
MNSQQNQNKIEPKPVHLFHAGRITIITVGLPARGKTHLARSLHRYLKWLGVPTKVFSVGNYRRKVVGTASSLPQDFFNPKSNEARHKIATDCLQDLIDWLEKEGQVGIYDASNTTEERRKEISDVLINQSICEKPEIIEANIRGVKITSPDTRINNHVELYEPISNMAHSFVKMINVGERIIVNNVKGYLQSGESTNDLSQKFDPGLNSAGIRYANKLKKFLLELREKERKQRIEQGWGDYERPSIQTAKVFEKDGGYNNKFPDDYIGRKKDLYNHRYPRGESYHDLTLRLEAIILELEHEKNDVLIIAHETVLKILYAYLFDRPQDEIPTIVIPKNYLIEIIPTAYGCRENRMQIFDNDSFDVPILSSLNR